MTQSIHPAGTIPWPADPIAATTHADPYPYYAWLAAERPLYRDEGLALWVAAGAGAVAAALASELCLVRPRAEPVPQAIAGSPAGEIFRRLVRFNDGGFQCPFKAAIVETLGALDPARLAGNAERRAEALLAELAPARRPEDLTRYMQALPVQTMASLLGVPDAEIAEAASWAASLAGCFSPYADAAALARGKDAAARLLGLFDTMFGRGEETMFAHLANAARRAGSAARDLIVANGIGFLFQSFEATSGLIGNTLLALARRADLREAVAAAPERLDDLIGEVLLLDPPTHNTRRFLAADGIVAGQEMHAGDGILVLLAAAGRDAAKIAPDARIDLARPARPLANFGAGRHACPADRAAPLIARIAVAKLLEAGLDPVGLADAFTYRRAPNVRGPIFG